MSECEVSSWVVPLSMLIGVVSWEFGAWLGRAVNYLLDRLGW